MEKIYYSKEMRARAQELRREGTPQENRLWHDYLKRYPYQFRRQKQFARYIVDFYCSSAKLVVEIDGMQHGEPDAMIHDRARTAYLESLGLQVLRFTNREIDEHFEAVCEMIDLRVRGMCK